MSSEAEVHHERLLWAGPRRWELEDERGHTVTVDVEPILDSVHAVGDPISIDGERYRILAKRGGMVVGGSVG